ncbi:MAG TPA: CHAT domain-containing protein, partial [Phnomibacter sp.]|nr:CHAT domain-containing protein [Phnomibacter sp.]
GSNLTVKERKIWINYWQFITGGLSKLAYDREGIRPVSLIRTSYEKLAKRLSLEYDVITYAFDWRRPLKESAAAFAKRIEALLKLNQPIKLVAHSMGGVLVRDLMVFEPDTYRKLYNSSGFQIVFLGSPLGGSYRIPYVLFGFDGIIKTISRIDLKNNMTDLLAIFSKYPGLLSLLPFTTHDHHDFSQPDTWQYLAKNLGKGNNWPLPDPTALKDFEQYRNTVLTASDRIMLGKAAYIAGRDKATPYDHRVRPDGTLEFLMTAEGDQSVTWDSGIPRQMTEAGNVYFAAATHGGLSTDPKLFEPIIEILKNGQTDKLSKERPQVRGKKITVAKEYDDFDLTEAGLERTLLALGSGEKAEEMTPITPIQVSVNHGDLMYASYPVMAGHFQGDGLFSVERAIDWHLGGELTKRVQLGIYPGRVGTYDLMLLTDERPKSFKGALIIGLGESGKLTSYNLSQSVEKAVIKYLTVYNSDQQRVNFTSGKVGLSVPAIGSSYGGLSVESGLRAIITGIQHANQNILQVYGEKAHIVQKLEFIEIYNNKALDYFYTLTKIRKEKDSGLLFSMSSNKIGQLPGRRMQTPTDDSSDWWTRITVRLVKIQNDNGKETVTGIRYNVSTSSAREEEATIRINLEIIESLLDEASMKHNWNEDLARTLYEMLIPNEFKEYLNKQANIFWIVDKETAAFPWELLKNSQKRSKPLCIGSGMMRQLATADYRRRIQHVTTRTAIIVADPDLQGAYSQLPGALREGKLVEKMLRESDYQTTLLTNERSSSILVSLFSRDHKVVHMAGHGIFNEDPNKASGMLIGKNAVLTPAEIKQMSTVPDFVFLNCCHLGAMNAQTEAITQQRYKLAANLGTQLIDNGAKAVIVAGWAVDDKAALEFAEVFYRQFLAGDLFGDAVRMARNAAFKLSGNINNTWGAYQTYGDPFFSLDPINRSKGSKTSYNFVMESQVEMELYNLLSRQETGTYTDDDIKRPLQQIIEEAQKAGILSVKAQEFVARITTELQEYDKAIEWYERMLKEKRATFEVASLEKYCNIRAKHAVEQAKQDIKDKEKRKKALQTLSEVLGDLERINSMGETGERLSLKASTIKRIAQLETGQAKSTAHFEAIKAYKNALKQYASDRYYPLTNWLNLVALAVHQKMLRWGKDETPGKGTALLMVDEELKACSIKAGASQDYWDRISVANLKLTSCLIDPAPEKLRELKMTFERVWANAGTKGQVKAEMENFDSLLDLLNPHGQKPSKVQNLIGEILTELLEFANNVARSKRGSR